MLCTLHRGPLGGFTELFLLEDKNIVLRESLSIRLVPLHLLSFATPFFLFYAPCTCCSHLSSNYLQSTELILTFCTAMLSFSVGFLLAISTLTFASPFPSQWSRVQKSDIERSVITRQDPNAPLQPNILFDILPADCVTADRSQSWTADQIRSTVTQFAKHYLPNLSKNGYSLLQPRLDSANAGIDPSIQPMFAFGCDSSKSILWTPMLNNMADATDIVVMNVDETNGNVVFCGVMTKAHDPAQGGYQICNAPK